jgi:hypothetical protein
MLVGITLYNRYEKPQFTGPLIPIVSDTPPLTVKSPPTVDAGLPKVPIYGRSEFKPHEYIEFTIERDGDTYIVKCDLIDDIPPIFDLRLYLSKSYDIQLNIDRSHLWQLHPDNEFYIVKTAVRLDPSLDDVGQSVGFRHNHGRESNGHYRMVLEFNCDKEVLNDNSCIILMVLK